jgi:hypothetical protein
MLRDQAKEKRVPLEEAMFVVTSFPSSCSPRAWLVVPFAHRKKANAFALNCVVQRPPPTPVLKG